MRKHNWHPKIIEDYLEKYYSIDSRDTARVYLKAFFTEMNETPDAFIKKKKKEIIKIIWEYAKHIEKRPPKTQNSMLSFIKKYLVRNRIMIDEVEWEDIRIRNNLKGARPITKKKTPTPQDLKKILSYTTGIKSKALFTFMATSGLRVDEALSITFNDIDLDKREVELIDETGKRNIHRLTFFTPESKELLELWIPERERMLQKRYKTSKYVRDQLENNGYKVKREDIYNHRNGNPYYRWKIYKDGKELSKDEIINMDDRVFPFDYITAQRMWANLLEKAGSPYNEVDKNPKLKFKKYHYNVHSIRRFWFTQLTSDRANEEYINFLGGHKSLLNQSYKDYFSQNMKKQMKQEYDSHLNCLSIFESQPDLTGVHKELKEKDTQIKELLERMKIQELQMDILKNSLELEKQKNGKK